MTTWRIYHADIETKDDHYEVQCLNMFGREVNTIAIPLNEKSKVQALLGLYKHIQTTFTFIWDDQENMVPA